MPGKSYDAIVVGSGPNGLAAAIVFARAGRSVLVVEAKETIGGGTRSAELTVPGFLHDVCSAIHPLGIASPFLKTLPLEQHGLEWIQPGVPLAHPFLDGSALMLDRSVDGTAASLGKDYEAYRSLMKPLSRACDKLMHDLLGPLSVPRYPIPLVRFGLPALRSAQGLARAKFREPNTRALFAGLAAHSVLPLNNPASASFGLILGLLGHAAGWPVVQGGSHQITTAMASYLRSLGGEIITGMPVQTLYELPHARVVLFDVSPRQLVHIAGDRLPPWYVRKLLKFRYGPGVCKIDIALDGQIPWKAHDCKDAGTVHLGSSLEEIAASEHDVWNGRHPEKPYVILAQQSLFDTSRAPEGKHTVWAYCHVPHGSDFDMTERILSQIERYAPGFRDLILGIKTTSPSEFERYNANYIGGDIGGGANVIGQLFARPMLRFPPYSTPAKNIFLCSASTPPGGGVHGMCGYHAAQAALRV